MPGTVTYTYNTLIAAIQAWAEDTSTEFVAALPEIVSRGESMLTTDLNLDIFDREDTGTLTASQRNQTVKGQFWQNIRSVWITPVGGGSRVYLPKRSHDWCNDYAPDVTVEAQPEYYAELSETEIFVVPTPDVAYPWFIRHTEQLETPLNVTNQNTWLADNHGDLLLDACMISAETFIQAEGFDISKWVDQYGMKMPQRRLEARNQIRSGDYSPVKNAARTVDNRA